MVLLYKKQQLPFHQKVITEEVPYSIGGGIGQSRVLMLMLGSSHIAEVQASSWEDKTIKEFLKQNHIGRGKVEAIRVNKSSMINDKYCSLETKLKELASNNEEFKILSDQILSQQAINNLRYDATDSATLIEGWVRSDQVEELEKAISDVTEFYDLVLTDPEEGETAPTYTKNEHFVSQFETVTDMFSKPSQTDVDPNPPMSWWYWFLFGMMMGDAGYGLLILIGGTILKKLMKPKGGMLKLINVITYSGIPTIFWGIVFGSYFGLGPNQITGGLLSADFCLFNPMDSTVGVLGKVSFNGSMSLGGAIGLLLVSIIVGALHLITGLIIKIGICIRQKSYAELLAKNLSWILIMVGIGLFFVHSLTGIIFVCIGAALIVLFGGAHKKGVVGKFAFGILGLYDVTSYLSDLLSYSRIMALVMSSGAVAMVMNTLTEKVMGEQITFFGFIAGALVFVVGHIFNIVLGLLSAYVHDSRLQYIEFFGKFYDGGGVDFKPLSIETKYINEIKK